MFLINYRGINPVPQIKEVENQPRWTQWQSAFLRAGWPGPVHEPA